MIDIASLRQRLEHFLTEPGQELGRFARFLRYQIDLWRFCARRLWADNVTAMSAALSFRTIFALVPALALAFLVLKSVGVLEDGKQSLRQLLDTSGFTVISVVHDVETTATGPTATSPAETKVITIADKVESEVASVEEKLTFKRIGPIGVALLVWTAISLLTAIERSLNRIFNAPRSRSLVRRMPMYWSVLTLGPLLLVTASYLGDRVVQQFGDAAGVAWLLAALGWTGPVLVSMLVLSILYKLIPNTRVRFRSAIGGAVVAVPLWMLAKWGFNLYVQQCVATGNLYGALGLLPLFLIWLNLSWLIFLFGAEIAHTAVNLDRFQSLERAEQTVLGPGDLLAAAIALAEGHLRGISPVTLDDLAQRLGLPPEVVESLMAKLQQQGLACPVEHPNVEAFVLGQSAERVSIAKILELTSPSDASTTRSYDASLNQAMTRLQAQAGDNLGAISLADLVARDCPGDEASAE